MNNLSWLLYSADLVSSVVVIITLLCVACSIGTFGFFIAMLVQKNAALEERKKYGSNDPDARYYELWNCYSSKLWKRFFVGFLITGILLSLVPSRTTIYLIASSEMGEEVIKNPEVKELMKDTFTLIKQEIKKNINKETKNEE